MTYTFHVRGSGAFLLVRSTMTHASSFLLQARTDVHACGLPGAPSCDQQYTFGRRHTSLVTLHLTVASAPPPRVRPSVLTTRRRL
jgi:hypothetical protein